PSRKRGRRHDAPQAAKQNQPRPAPVQEGVSEAATKRPPAARRREKPRRDRRGPQRQPRIGAYEKRAPKKLVPITPAMEEGKEYMRSFGDLLQFHKKKEAGSEPGEQAASPPTAGNGSAESADKETRRQGDKEIGV